jgi:hypothetical protein
MRVSVQLTTVELYRHFLTGSRVAGDRRIYSLLDAYVHADLVTYPGLGDPSNCPAIVGNTVDAALAAIVDSVHRRRMVEWNYEVAPEHYSHEAVTRSLASLLDEAGPLTAGDDRP